MLRLALIENLRRVGVTSIMRHRDQWADQLTVANPTPGSCW
jgi:hypothetical protein